MKPEQQDMPGQAGKDLPVSGLIAGAEIDRCLKSRWAGRNIVCYFRTDSTNLRARELALQGAPEGTLVIAESQEAGRGRRGRRWSSPPGTGIFMTIVLRPDVTAAQASMITLTAALAVRRAIWTTAGLETQIKWPNDLVCRGKKLCGILTEMELEQDRIAHVITGIGVNANTGHFPEEIAKTATSVRLETGQPVSRAALAAEICNAFEICYEKFQETGDLSAFQEEYNRFLVNRDNRVRVLSPGHEYEGWAQGINDLGELLVRRDDGVTEAVASGEVSVRGVYGYT